jgi:hypothetical protein
LKVISTEVFDAIVSLNIGGSAKPHSSWAIWAAPAPENIRSNIGISAMPEKFSGLLDQLNPNVVILGLNPSDRKDLKAYQLFEDFHDDSSFGNDYRLRLVFNNLPHFRGAYITDLFPYQVKTNSNSVRGWWKHLPEAERTRERKHFLDEIDTLGGKPQVFITLGSAVTQMFQDVTSGMARLPQIKIWHFAHKYFKKPSPLPANYNRDLHYQQQVLEQLALGLRALAPARQSELTARLLSSAETALKESLGQHGKMY